MEESEDVRFAEVNCLEEGSEELCKAVLCSRNWTFSGIRIRPFLVPEPDKTISFPDPDKTFYCIRLVKQEKRL
jgi:hypothetical protein